MRSSVLVFEPQRRRGALAASFPSRSATTLTLLCVSMMCVASITADAQAPAAQPAPPAPQPDASVIVLENDCVRYEIGGDAGNVRVVDKASGTDYCKHDAETRVAQVRIGEKWIDASAAAYTEGTLQLVFGDSGVKATLAVTVATRYIVLAVTAIEGEGVEELAFVNIPLALKGGLDEPFAACALALNLQTRVTEIPGPSTRLRATCYSRFGLVGAKVALLACPQADLRDVMKEAVSAAEELPRTNIGGPWALDAEINRGSYLFDFGQCTEQTVDKWIAFAKRLGMNQIDFHTGGSLRFGDCRPNPSLFPNGRASVKAVTDKLHAAGISAGLHTYAFFMAKDTPYVTPVPDPRLGKDATFTLSEALGPEAVTVPVDETTEKMSTTTGFGVRNSVTIQIDTELITYGGISKQPPYAFTQCSRGACGTTVAPHEKGAKVYHLRECFGLFAPDADSTLLMEVAKSTADTFNECGFDMIYLDALDGEDVLAGGEWGWHYGSKFAWEIARQLNKPALFEMSTFHHHLWYIRARMGAWDHPNRAHKEFIDIHAKANLDGAKMFLPMNLGWWSVKVWNGPRNEPTYPDDIEYLMCKCIGGDMSLSLMGVNPDTIDTVPAYQQLVPIFQQYEELRHAKYFSESVKEQLRAPGKEFTLEKDTEGKWRFRRVQYDKHKVCGLDGWSNTWTTNNPFGEQPVQLRIETLWSAAPYDSPEAVVIEDFANPADVYKESKARDGVQIALTRSAEQVKAGDASGLLSGTSPHEQPIGSWGKVGKTFEPMLNIEKQQALGVWVYGDGQGELLNIQLGSPSNITGGLGDAYVKVDFTGWRYFELIENEGGNIDNWGWPYGGGYAIYREDVSSAHIERLSLWLNNLPKDKPVACYLSPIKALPGVASPVKNPKVTIGGKTLMFPCELKTGYYIEFRAMDNCKMYGRNGEFVSDIVPQGDVPALAAGANPVEFGCDPTAGFSARAYVTVITRGDLL